MGVSKCNTSLIRGIYTKKIGTIQGKIMRLENRDVDVDIKLSKYASTICGSIDWNNFNVIGLATLSLELDLKNQVYGILKCGFGSKIARHCIVENLLCELEYTCKALLYGYTLDGVFYTCFT